MDKLAGKEYNYVHIGEDIMMSIMDKLVAIYNDSYAFDNMTWERCRSGDCK